MKISKENIKNLILTLTKIHDSLSDGECFDIQNELTDSIKEKEGDFILPDKWSLKAYNEDYAKIIYPYINKKYNHGWSVTDKAHYRIYLNFDNTLNYADTGMSAKQDYLEISPEDYIKHVIEKDDEYQRGKDN